MRRLVKGRKSHKSAVVVIPHEEIWGPIQELRRVWDRQLRRWMPHITFLYPFRFAEELPSSESRAREVCASFTPFSVRLERFRSFSHSRGNHTIWLEPHPSEPFVKLQDALWRAFPECDDVRKFEDGYTPHLSIGQYKGEEIAPVLEELGASWAALEFTVDSICIICRGEPPDDIFRVASSIPLGEAQDG
jgi:poly(A) polymerase